MKPKALAIFETNEDGTSFTLKVEGVKGPNCQKVQDASKAVGKLVSDKRTPDFDVVQPAVQNHVRA